MSLRRVRGLPLPCQQMLICEAGGATPSLRLTLIIRLFRRWIDSTVMVNMSAAHDTCNLTVLARRFGGLEHFSPGLPGSGIRALGA